MYCEETIVQAPDHRLQSIADRARKEHIPLNGHFDVTYRCNLRCSHCYAGHLVDQSSAQSGEVDTAQATELLAEVAEAGCLFLILSGGEPLLRRDFLEIYVEARKLGMVVSVFTNATLVNQDHVDAFKEYPPEAVDVSVYGSTADTYERVTRVSGSFRQATRGLEMLLAAGVPVKMKVPILRDNVDEVESVRALASKYGVSFRVDSRVMPRLDGDLGPQVHQVDPERAVGIEMSAPESCREMTEYFERRSIAYPDSEAATERLYICGAGLASFHADPSGLVRPCLFSRSRAYDAFENGFQGAWEAASASICADTSSRPKECIGCMNILICGYCPGVIELEGIAGGPEERYSCRLGKARRAVIESVAKEVEHVGPQ